MTRQGESSDARFQAPGYERVEPRATYAPWALDSEFDEANSVTRDYTLVDRYRSYELWQLVGHVADIPGDILEVGVWRGGSGVLMACRAARTSPEKRVFLADTFSGVVKAGPKDQYYRGGEHANADADQVTELYERLGLGNVTVLTGVFPEDTGDAIADRTIALCHVDVDVYQGAKDVTEWVWPRMPVGGIVVFDDYGFYGCEGVTEYVNETKTESGKVFVHNLNGHGVLVKTIPTENVTHR